jgi:microcystin degradation protein MlrC
MKLVIGLFKQETDSFSISKTDLQSFKELQFLMGDEIISYHSKKGTEIGGFIEIAEKESIELLPLVSAYGIPGGIVTAETYQKIKMLFLEKLRQIKQFDGVLLALHGAMAVEGLDDPEGDFLEAIRTQIGKDIPIVSSFDMHANFTKKMMDNLDALTGYNTHPHIDIFETGERAINIMISILKKEIKPTIAMKRLPMIAAAANGETTHGPLREAMKMAKEIEKESGVISTAIFAVQPWLDLYDTGFSVVVVTDNNLGLAQSKANEIARMLWESRKDFAVEEFTVEEALTRAREIEGGPIVFSDSADNTTGGAAGDSTHVLKKLVDTEIEFPVALTITDSETVKKCIEKGVGERITVEVGGKINKNFTQPLLVSGYIKTISDGKYIWKGKSRNGITDNMGKTVVLIINRNIYLVITELRAMTTDPELFISLGLSLKEMKIIIVKSVSDFKANYEPLAKEIIMLDTPGPCSSNLLGLPFKNIKRPMYPWEQMDDYKI